MEHFASEEDKLTIISCPGYVPSTENAAKKYGNNFMNPIETHTERFGFFGGMHDPGSDRFTKFKNAINDHLAHNNLNIHIMKNSDHRKMLFFIKESESSKKYTDIDNANWADYLNTISVKAVLIGSSNQSFSTYFGGSVKGECDLLLYISDSKYGLPPSKNADDNYTEDNMWNNATVVSKAVKLKAGSPEKTLKKMLEEVFDHYVTK